MASARKARAVQNRNAEGRSVHRKHPHLTIVTVILLALVFAARPAAAHCDTLDGPVVTAARSALDSGDVSLVLVWVQKKDEAEVKEAFEKTRKVRALGADARGLADMYFFETLVRIHRAGEGFPYTGLKPPGQDMGPAIPAADKALETGSLAPLEDLLVDAVRDGLNDRFREALEKKKHAGHTVEAGREFVKAYVIFLHYAEGVYEATRAASHGHSPAEESHESHGDSH